MSAAKRIFVTEILRSRRAQVPRAAGRNALLVLARHGESEFNKQDRFTGLADPELTSTGMQEAVEAGRVLRERGLHFDVAFTSRLKRARQSLALILKEIGAQDIPVLEDAALNERDYGKLTGLTREEARSRWGEAQVHAWRRSYAAVPPDGESLEMTAARTRPFFNAHLKPAFARRQRALVVAHGNSLRSIVMSLEKLTPEQIVTTTFATGTLLIYRMTAWGTVVERTEIPVAPSG